MARIGVFVCWCGRNIAGTVDVNSVCKKLEHHPGVVHSVDYTYMCSDPGQKMMVEAIKEKGLTGVIVCACSPQLHENTFRKAAKSAGLNPYMCEMANIREHCSWVHPEMGAEATEKATELCRIGVEKVKHNRPLRPVKIPVTRRALVIGGGIAGIQAALDISRSGYEVVLVEKGPSVGGHMARLSVTYPRLENARYLLRPRVAQLLRNSRIRVLTNSELEEFSGYVGNFKAKIKRKPTGERDEDDLGEEVCPQGNSNLDQEETLEVEVGAVVVASGFGLYPLESISEYGGGSIENVFNSLQWEQLLRSSQSGEFRTPDGKVPKEVVFIQCVRSRDREKGVPYCSSICCLYTAKQAMLYKEKVPDGQAYVFYLDIRVPGKEDEEFIQRAQQDYGIVYLRGRVSRVFPEADKVMVWGADTLSGKNVEISADAVVLATALTPSRDAIELAKKVGISYDVHGFFSEAHPKLRPVETNTAGIFLAGTCQAPRGIAGTIAHASGAASKVVELFSSDELEREPTIARVNEEQCVACFDCLKICPYRAISEKKLRDKNGNLVKAVASVNEGLCQGCGLCVATCRSKSIDLDGFTEEQLFAEIGAL